MTGLPTAKSDVSDFARLIAAEVGQGRLRVKSRISQLRSGSARIPLTCSNLRARRRRFARRLPCDIKGMYPGYGRDDARQAGPLMATTEEDAMFKTSLLCGAALFASVGLAAGAGTPENAPPPIPRPSSRLQPLPCSGFLRL